MGQRKAFIGHREHLWGTMGLLWGTESTYRAMGTLMGHLWGTMGHLSGTENSSRPLVGCDGALMKHYRVPWESMGHL